VAYLSRQTKIVSSSRKKRASPNNAGRYQNLLGLIRKSGGKLGGNLLRKDGRVNRKCGIQNSESRRQKAEGRGYATRCAASL
jgi:hypothetical protein